MRTFRPGLYADPGTRQLAREIEQAANRADPFVEFQVLHAAPQKVRAGMVCYFDGTDYDPGSGEGLYRRSADNASWVFIG